MKSQNSGKSEGKEKKREEAKMPSRLTKACTGARDVSLIMMASIARVPVMARR